MTIIKTYGTPPIVARCRLLKPIPRKKWSRIAYQDTVVCKLYNLVETNEELTLF